jgi:hypothetical protein
VPFSVAASDATRPISMSAVTGRRAGGVEGRSGRHELARRRPPGPGLSTSGSGYERLHRFFIWYSPHARRCSPQTPRVLIPGRRARRTAGCLVRARRLNSLLLYAGVVHAWTTSERFARRLVTPPCRVQHAPKCRERPRSAAC